METNALNTFLEEQEILHIAPQAGDAWIANVYFTCRSAQRLYFIGSLTARYGALLSEDPRLAFGSASHAPGDHSMRKGIQGTGTAHVAKTKEDIELAVSLHNTKFPAFAKDITADNIANNSSGTCVWIIEPNYIKYWDDELYGVEGSREFKF